jgi:hypothetical protein
MPKNKEPALYEKMLELADGDKLTADHILRQRANELKEIIEGPGEITPKRFLGRWARARKAWCEYTGEPLVEQAVIETGTRLIQFLKGSPVR